MEQYSWNQLSENKIVKTLDYSTFRTFTVIPQAFYTFFSINTENIDDMHLTLIDGNNNFDGLILKR